MDAATYTIPPPAMPTKSELNIRNRTKSPIFPLIKLWISYQSTEARGKLAEGFDSMVEFNPFELTFILPANIDAREESL
jgi:hypothetical protein